MCRRAAPSGEGVRACLLAGQWRRRRAPVRALLRRRRHRARERRRRRAGLAHHPVERASKSWTGAATMADASLNRRMTVRLGDAVAFAQIGIVGLDGQMELEALRLYGLPEAAPALLCGTHA